MVRSRSSEGSHGSVVNENVASLSRPSAVLSLFVSSFEPLADPSVRSPRVPHFIEDRMVLKSQPKPLLAFYNHF